MRGNYRAVVKKRILQLLPSVDLTLFPFAVGSSCIRHTLKCMRAERLEVNTSVELQWSHISSYVHFSWNVVWVFFKHLQALCREVACVSLNVNSRKIEV